jgi:hypothetical protein
LKEKFKVDEAAKQPLDGGRNDSRHDASRSA